MKNNIVLLTDFGDKSYVGQMKGVILSINPLANIIDLAHSVEPQNTREAELILETSYTYFSENSIFIVVVDPGVGSKRDAVIVEYNKRIFIGPDNGIFGFMKPDQTRSFTIENKDFMLANISNTFHGRDIFAPAAAYLSKGEKPEHFGERLEHLKKHENLNNYEDFTGQIIAFDSFGNAISSIDREMLEKFKTMHGQKPLNIELNGTTLEICKTFSDVQKNFPLAYWGSFDKLEIAINQQNARIMLNLKLFDKIMLI